MRSLRILTLVLLLGPGCRATGLFSRHDPLDEPNLASESTASLQESLNSPAENGALPASPASPAESSELQRQLAGRGPGQMQTAPDPQPRQQNLQALPVSELLARGEQAFNEQRLREARLHLETIIQKQAAHPRAHHLLAVVSDLEGRFGDSEHHYQLALQADSNNAAIVGDLGYSYLLQGRDDLAEQYLVQARVLDPSHVNAAQNLALLYSRRGDYAAARTTLAEILPPPEVERKLAALFPAGGQRGAPSNPMIPGAPYDSQRSANVIAAQHTGAQPQPQQEYHHTAPTPHDPRYAARNPGYPAATSSADPGSINDRLAAIERSGYPSNGAPIVVDAPRATASRTNQPVSVPGPDSYSGPSSYATSPTGPSPGTMASTAPASPTGAVQSAVGFRPEVGQFSGGDGPSSPTAPPPQRRWPPTTWPPEPQSSGVQPVSGEAGGSAPATGRNAQGVMYLMPNRPAQQPAATLMTTPVPTSPAPAPRTSSSLTEAVHYGTGPGNSRTVTWNGPIPQAPAAAAPLASPATEAPPETTHESARRTAAAIGLNAGSHQPYPLVERTSPGTSSYYGSQFPAPARQLPGMSLPETLPASGLTSAPDVSPTHQHETPVPNTANQLPYIEFEPVPVPATPSLQSYADERARYDSQYNAQIEQTYGQSPSNYIPSPANATPAPVHQIPDYRSRPTAGAPPLNPETGTPWPGRPAQTATSGTAGTATQSNNQPAQVPNSNGIIVPPPYSASQRATSPTVPAESYPYRTPADAYQGPVIVPGGY